MLHALHSATRVPGFTGLSHAHQFTFLNSFEQVVFCDTIASLFAELGGRTCVLPEYAYNHEGAMHKGRELLVLAKALMCWSYSQG